jgi:hypothetical protein
MPLVAAQTIPRTITAGILPTVPVTASAPQLTSLCVPTIVLTGATGSWSVFTLVATCNSEPVARRHAGATDGRIFIATSQQTAGWYIGYVPALAVSALPVYYPVALHHDLSSTRRVSPSRVFGKSCG